MFVLVMLIVADVVLSMVVARETEAFLGAEQVVVDLADAENRYTATATANPSNVGFPFPRARAPPTQQAQQTLTTSYSGLPAIPRDPIP